MGTYRKTCSYIGLGDKAALFYYEHKDMHLVFNIEETSNTLHVDKCDSVSFYPFYDDNKGRS